MYIRPDGRLFHGISNGAMDTVTYLEYPNAGKLADPATSIPRAISSSNSGRTHTILDEGIGRILIAHVLAKHRTRFATPGMRELIQFSYLRVLHRLVPSSETVKRAPQPTSQLMKEQPRVLLP